ncbi:stage V sporulation protein AA [Polycladomyces abyssicola]|uniref:Stage V sporulation protein AA n=2 Tax=Polycladomyces abyssicola TaxID=1125966 RepID=A0A8D5UG73_9BACL|nr:stage V sporulation protein AA [Polycladomyces abyssicola]
MSSMVYIRLRKKVTAHAGKILRLRDVAQVIADEPYATVREIPVYEPDFKEGNLAVLDLIDVVRRIRSAFPGLDVRSIGPAQVIIELQAERIRPRLWWVAGVWLLLFVGSALAIMNFHTDVSMREVHERIYYLMTGQHVHEPLVLQIPYSLGIGIGMIVFFNHLFKRRLNDEPSPLELEMYLYQEHLDQYVIEHEKQKERTQS